MNLAITTCSRRAGLPADNAIVHCLEIHLEERGCTHVQWLFLYPEPGCFIILFIKRFQLPVRQGVQLFHSHYGNIGTVFFLLAFCQVIINLPGTEQYFLYCSSIFYKWIIDHFLETSIG